MLSPSMAAHAKTSPELRLRIMKDTTTQVDGKDLKRYHSYFKKSSSTNVILLIVALYIALCVSIMCSPRLQSIFVYMHYVRYPWGDLTNLSRFGIPDGRAVSISTESGDTMHGYHILPPGADAIAGLALQGQIRDMFFMDKIRKAENIVIYFHGNAATRAHPRRIDVQKHIAAYCNAHVITFDYRGFGDSTGTPTEEGTVEDAATIMKWLISHNISNDTKIFLYGESLGTGIIISFLYKHQAWVRKDNLISGVILMAPFVSLPEAAISYPLAAPLRIFPLIKSYLVHHLYFRYPNAEMISAVQSPLLIMHGTNDIVIPNDHGSRLFAAYTNGRFNGSCRSDTGDDSNGGCDPVSGSSKYVEVVGAGHNDIFRFKEWLLEVPHFMNSVTK